MEFDEDRLDRAFAALGDPIRRRIIARLSISDATVKELAAPFDVSIQAISKHLQVLEAAGLISRSRDAQKRPCHLIKDNLAQLTGWINEYSSSVGEKFHRLEEVLDAGPAEAGRI
ncbi:ArsR/SmtB family transcription factor [Arthrobacter russicus]|jgi:DNA-binding transcriptional ArsR family regulator|uniref:DNA-binding transcriptional ArsR family regulator n=1 Tax=Arthrobacter russicus TaxID=172040 RepID=A0ABU1JDZ8_9MICC|nr:metalloregulator ArsR/SmtB family transcription factor [Arthrobacter russicus]MBQ1444412.1 winged helix-turn-helix transcriptional regulator [Renibacterium sp.]MDN5668234.1 metalloregulator ArsR/SmtB family transcription factor [Renibacterium salmoninarum]MDR6270668.1 DNA-binding transcriptional ArsR family regulator [Arthrobacter russicus]